MKRQVFLTALAIVLISAFIFSGCTQSTPAPAPAPAPTSKPVPTASPAPAPTSNPAWPKSLRFVSARVGTSTYVVHATAATLMTKYLGIKVVPEGGSPGQIIMLLNDKDTDLGLNFTDMLYEAARGTWATAKGKFSGIRIMWCCAGGSPIVYHVRADSGITRIEDLKGKKVMCRYPSNPTFGRVHDLNIEAAGMNLADIKEVSFMGLDEATPALKEGRVDAFIHAQPFMGVAGWIQELNLQVPVRIFAPPKEKLEAVAKKYPYIVLQSLKATDWKDMVFNKDLPGLSAPELVCCRADLPDDLVYELVKATFDHVDELRKSSPFATAWTENPVFSPGVALFHPGAIKYWKEKGLWTKEVQDTQDRVKKELGS